MGHAVKKNFEFHELFNFMILKMRETGIQDYIFKQYARKRGAKSECGNKDKFLPLNLEAVISAFLVYMAGLGFCVKILMFEIFWVKMKNKNE